MWLSLELTRLAGVKIRRPRLDGFTVMLWSRTLDSNLVPIARCNVVGPTTRILRKVHFTFDLIVDHRPGRSIQSISLANIIYFMFI